MKKKFCMAILEKEVAVRAKLEEMVEKARNVLHNKSGLSHTVEVLIWAGAAAAVILLVVGLVTTLIKTDIMTWLSAKIKAIFDYT